jgi:DeoR/GlpR family transcriptional regulator of sugar metabolism
MQEVLRLLEARESVRVRELARAFSVSEVTIRSDLAELARRGLVARVRGGVRALPPQSQSELSFDVRLRIEADRKQAIARAAAAMVEDREAIALDSSTSAYYLALELRDKRDLVVVTNGLLIAAALADAPGITILLTGGMLRLPSMSLIGHLGADVLRATRIDKGFLGARGLSLEHGLMELNPDEIRIKQEMASACDRVICLLDSTKWHRGALLSFVPAEEVDVIVTDSDAPPEQVDAWRANGTEVVTAQVVSPQRTPVRAPSLRRGSAQEDGAR